MGGTLPGQVKEPLVSVPSPPSLVHLFIPTWQLWALCPEEVQIRGELEAKDNSCGERKKQFLSIKKKAILS